MHFLNVISKNLGLQSACLSVCGGGGGSPFFKILLEKIGGGRGGFFGWGGGGGVRLILTNFANTGLNHIFE